MGKTLFEMLKAKAKGPVELQITNPLGVKLGTSINIREIDVNGLTFYVKQILEYKRTIRNQEFVFTDYELLARPIGGEDVRVRLRLNPMEHPDKASGLMHNVVLLKLYDQFPYNEELHKAVQDTTKKFEVLEDGVCTERYFRINDVQDSYKPTVTIVKDEKITEVTDLEKQKLEYWDFWREIKDEAGQPFNQFLFIEMDSDTGFFQMWRGEEITPEQVTVL